MTATYIFLNEHGTHALRTDDAGQKCSMPWSTDPVQPLDVDGLWGRVWVEDGSPVPAPYEGPPTVRTG